jgi:hypothetical protein
VLWCLMPLSTIFQLYHGNDGRFVFSSSCLYEGSCLICVCFRIVVCFFFCLSTSCVSGLSYFFITLRCSLKPAIIFIFRNGQPYPKISLFCHIYGISHLCEVKELYESCNRKQDLLNASGTYQVG